MQIYRAKHIPQYMSDAQLQASTIGVIKDVEHMEQVRQPMRIPERRLLCHPLEAEACLGFRV